MSARVLMRLVLRLAPVVLVAALLVPSPAFGDVLTPESGGSPNADHIDTLYKITLYVAIVIFLIVEGTLIWTLVRRRSGPDAAQMRGNTPLEVGWTLAAALILVVLTVVTFVYLDDIENPPESGPEGLNASQTSFASIDQPAPPSGRPYLKIGVNGQQYVWRYDYPGKRTLFSYHTMVVPVDTTVVLRITGSDVIHSWWIPKLGGKADGVPGHINETWFKIPPDKAGTTFRGQCAELCGSGHADMRAAVRAVTPAEYQQWAEQQANDIEEAGKLLAEQRKRREGGISP